MRTLVIKTKFADNNALNILLKWIKKHNIVYSTTKSKGHIISYSIHLTSKQYDNIAPQFTKVSNTNQQ